MALRYLKQERRFALRGSILLTDGTTHTLSADNIVRYYVDESSTGGDAITIGDTRAAEYNLEIEDAAHALTAAQLLGARVSIEIWLDGTFDPLGVWYISRARISRQSATISLNGADALSEKADMLYVDGQYPATLGQILQRAADQAGLTLKNAVFRNSAVSVASTPEWDAQTNSVRAVIGYVAGCAGGFARIDRAGALEIVPYNTAMAGEVSADYFATLNVGMGRSFAFNCLQVMHFGTNIYTRYAIDAGAEDNAGNTLRISDNPLMTASIAQSLVAALTGMSGQAISADWIGDPGATTGALLTFVDTDGARYSGIITGQTLSIDGSLRMTTDAALPETISEAYATDTLYTPSGRVNITAIEGRIKVWASDEIALQVGNVHIGGTNLLLNSGSGVTTANYEMKSYYLAEPLTTGETVTVQIWGALGSDRTAFRVYNSGGHQFLKDTVWDGSKHTCTFTWQEYGDNDRITIWQAPSGGTSASTIERVKLERGNKGTDWAPSPKDPTSAYEVIDGSQLRITKDSVRIDTPEFDINVSGADGDAHFGANGMAVDVVNSPSVMPRYTGPYTLRVGGTPNGTSVFTTLTDAFSVLCNKFIPATVTIYMDADSTENTAVLSRTIGANININGGNRTLNGKIQLNDVGSRITIQYLTIATNGGGNVVDVSQCTHVTLTSCKIIGDGGGVYYGCVWFASRGTLMNCEIYNSYMAARSNGGSALYLQNCDGSGNTYACGSYQASLLGMYGRRPAATYGLYCERGSWMSEDPGASTSGGAPVTPSATTTVTLTATNTRTHAGSWYSGTNVLSQGVSGGTSFYGYMWFDLSAISGKTVKAASIRLYRRAGVGRGVPVDVYIGTHNATGPSGGLNMVNAYSDHLVGKVDQKETLSASVATAAVQALASGAAKGLFVHSGSSGYAQFDGFDGSIPPQLTVTYQ